MINARKNSYLEKRLKDFHFTVFEIEELMSLTRTYLFQNTFSFQGNFYKQSESLAMGSSLSPILTDIYVYYFEGILLFENFFFPFHMHYIDDIFTLIDTSLHKVIFSSLIILSGVSINTFFSVINVIFLHFYIM